MSTVEFNSRRLENRRSSVRIHGLWMDNQDLLINLEAAISNNDEEDKILFKTGLICIWLRRQIGINETQGFWTKLGGDITGVITADRDKKDKQKKSTEKRKTMDQLMAKMKKVMKLANNGVDGEKRNAEKLLRRMMRESGVTMDMLEEVKKHDHDFRFTPGVTYRRLCAQIIASVCGTTNMYTVGNKNIIRASVTEIEKVEILFKINIYQKALKREISLVFPAFVQANDIYRKEDGSPIECKEKTEEEMEMEFEIAKRAENMEKTPVNKQLSVGTT